MANFVEIDEKIFDPKKSGRIVLPWAEAVQRLADARYNGDTARAEFYFTAADPKYNIINSTTIHPNNPKINNGGPVTIPVNYLTHY